MIGLVVAAVIAAITGFFFDGEADEAVVQARETIEDNYFEAGLASASTTPRSTAWCASCGSATTTASPTTSTEQQLRAFEAQTSGRFTGIGLTVSEVQAGLRVGRVFEDTPAEAAGIEVGDLIVAVEGKSIAGVSSEVSTAQIKGPPGTEVMLTVRPAAGGPARRLTVERADVRIPAADGGSARSTGARSQSSASTPSARAPTASFARPSSGSTGRAPRASSSTCAATAAGCSTRPCSPRASSSRTGRSSRPRAGRRARATYDAVGDAIEPRPTVVLVDRDTASASEILTAALQDNDLATVVGTRTFGKGVFQEVIELDAGGALDLTVGEYLTADGTSILGKGVEPDVTAAGRSEDAA